MAAISVTVSGYGFAPYAFAALAVFLVAFDLTMTPIIVVAGVFGYVTRKRSVMHWALFLVYLMAVLHALGTPHCEAEQSDAVDKCLATHKVHSWWAPLNLFMAKGSRHSLAAEQLWRGIWPYVWGLCHCTDTTCIQMKADDEMENDSCLAGGPPSPNIPNTVRNTVAGWLGTENMKKTWVIWNSMQSDAHNALYVGIVSFFVFRYIHTGFQEAHFPTLKVFTVWGTSNQSLLYTPSWIVMVSVVMALPTRLITITVLREYNERHALGQYMQYDEGLSGMNHFFNSIVFCTSPLPWIALGFMVALFMNVPNQTPQVRSWVLMCVVTLCWSCVDMVHYRFATVPTWIEEKLLDNLGAYYWVLLLCLLALPTLGFWHAHSVAHFTCNPDEVVWLLVVGALGVQAIKSANVEPLLDRVLI